MKTTSGVILILAALVGCATAQASPPAGVTTTKDEPRFDLNGEWQADFTLENGGFKKERVMVRQIGTELVATKITGDEYVPAGKVTVRGSYKVNPFTAEQVCAFAGYADPIWSKIKVTILDSRHFKVEGGCSGNVIWERLGNPTVALDSSILFDFDKSQLKAEAQNALADILRFLNQEHPGAHLFVAGYTDDTGADAHNLHLSERRAQAVAAWLQLHGVPQDHLRVHGLGKEHPRYPNVNDEARSRNRRVEIEILD